MLRFHFFFLLLFHIYFLVDAGAAADADAMSCLLSMFSYFFLLFAPRGVEFEGITKKDVCNMHQASRVV